MISASALTASEWTVSEFTAALTAAESKAATASSDALDSAPVCGRYKRKNCFVARCGQCDRHEADCQQSLAAHTIKLAADKAVSQASLQVKIANSMIPLAQFMSGRPGLVCVVGVRLLRYYFTM